MASTTPNWNALRHSGLERLVSQHLKKRQSETRDIFPIYKEVQTTVLFYLAAKHWISNNGDSFNLSRK